MEKSASAGPSAEIVMLEASVIVLVGVPKMFSDPQGVQVRDAPVPEQVEPRLTR
jgi:hypothetical protein